MATLLGRPSNILILEAINKVNIEQFTFDDFDFKVPVVNTDHGKNTYLELVGKGQYCGEHWISYNRLDFEVLFGLTCSGKAETVIKGMTTIGAIVDGLNTSYGLALEQVDIVEPFSTVVDADTATAIELNAHVHSYAYFGKFLVHFDTAVGLTLDDIIPDPVLDGLLMINIEPARPDLVEVIIDPVLDGLNEVPLS